MKRDSIVNVPKPRFNVRKVEEETYIINESVLKQYDPRAEGRAREALKERDLTDRSGATSFMGSLSAEVRLRNMDNHRPGYTSIDYALSEAMWTIRNKVNTFAYDSERIRKMDDLTRGGDEWYRENYKIENIEEVTAQVKRAAHFYGAALVGITELNRRWLLTHRKSNHQPLEFPEDLKHVIVIAIEMNAEGIATAPTCPGTAATGQGYLRMAITASCLAEFIRNLGYRAIPAGNDLALSIPLAIDAGLGQLGRNGLLITPELGSRIRLCKVFTNLPLVPDKPIDFGVTDFCKTCKLCSKACEVGAISEETEPSWETACEANNPGTLKWHVDTKKCYKFWYDNGTECATCIAVCPYNPGPKLVTPKGFWNSPND